MMILVVSFIFYLLIESCAKQLSDDLGCVIQVINLSYNQTLDSLISCKCTVGIKTAMRINLKIQ